MPTKIHYDRKRSRVVTRVRAAVGINGHKKRFCLTNIKLSKRLLLTSLTLCSLFVNESYNWMDLSTNTLSLPSCRKNSDCYIMVTSLLHHDDIATAFYIRILPPRGGLNIIIEKKNGMESDFQCNSFSSLFCESKLQKNSSFAL